MTKKPINVVKITNVITLAATKIFHIEGLDVEFSNGQKRNYQRLKSRGNGAVLIIPVLANGLVAMIYEFSAGSERYELALPKGKIDDGESILEAANRELQEEIGYASNNLRHIKTITLAPSYQDNTTHIVLATDLYPNILNGDEPEPLTVVYKNLNNIDILLNDEDLTEARTIAALYMAKNLLKL